MYVLPSMSSAELEARLWNIR